MRSPRITTCLLAVVSAVAVFACAPGSAEAQKYASIKKTYKVQVEYWFFDTDYYYWSTVFESDDQADAEFVFLLLQSAKDDGQLNAYAPNSYWRYFAVDVRLVVAYKYPPSAIRAQRFEGPIYRSVRSNN